VKRPRAGIRRCPGGGAGAKKSQVRHGVRRGFHHWPTAIQSRTGELIGSYRLIESDTSGTTTGAPARLPKWRLRERLR
jgi:hypothetical protein